MHRGYVLAAHKWSMWQLQQQTYCCTLDARAPISGRHLPQLPAAVVPPHTHASLPAACLGQVVLACLALVYRTAWWTLPAACTVPVGTAWLVPSCLVHAP